MTPADLVRDEHLRQRGYFVPAQHPRFGDFEVPGASFLMAATPWRLRRPAPSPGEHNAEVYAEVGVGPAELERLSAAGVI
jgi:crotonobetainyl-CoA:carnitine CoA-transferase CaiB-like acyl-CoA transferase